MPQLAPSRVIAALKLGRNRCGAGVNRVGVGKYIASINESSYEVIPPCM